MTICGLKLTHDGSVAVIRDNTLLFSTEIEKLRNNPRYASVEDTALIEEILSDEDLSLEDIDLFAVDGWGGFDEWDWTRQTQLTLGDDFHKLVIKDNGKPYDIRLAHYHEKGLGENVLDYKQAEGLIINKKSFPYRTYLHVTGHITSAYCSSPFAARQEDSYILVWDGGTYPRLYFFDAHRRSVENLGPVFPMMGNIYTMFAQFYEPYKVNGSFVNDDSSLAGKVMAYVAKGRNIHALRGYMRDIFDQHHDGPKGLYLKFVEGLGSRMNGTRYPDADILRSFHHFLEELLVEKLIEKVRSLAKPSANICLAGGCALNIKWNSALRNTGYFKEVYVPPFPNDAGSAIGMAAAAMISETDQSMLQWSVYKGPAIIDNEPYAGWSVRRCAIPDLAQLLHQTGEPVVFLNGRAELGPRALGNRSIIASPQAPAMKDILNKVKKREGYRPVSPMCIEERAQEIFDPGIPDPFMLFDHILRDSWEDRIPAIRHLDGSARLQTISSSDNPLVYRLLHEFEKHSGLPVLCNTSANLNGSGFFPDVYSATRWNQVNYVWCNDKLFVKDHPVIF